MQATKPKLKRLIKDLEDVPSMYYFRCVLSPEPYAGKVTIIDYLPFLTYICIKDKALDKYLTKFIQSLDTKVINTRMIVEELYSLGYDVEKQLNLYLHQKEQDKPGYIQAHSFSTLEDILRQEGYDENGGEDNLPKFPGMF